MKIKKIITDFLGGKPFYEKLRLIVYKYSVKDRQKKTEQDILFRANGGVDEKYLDIKKIKDIHKGERCFIVATGPSLTIEDLEKLKGEITIGINSIVRLYDQTDWRPTYYGIQDWHVYQALEDTLKINIKPDDRMFAAKYLSDKFELPGDVTLFPFNGDYHLFEGKIGTPNAKFSDDAYITVYDGYSVTYSMIQLAVYMGFEKIYLLGCDCSWGKNKKNHVAESGYVDKNALSNPVKQRVAYKCALDYTKTHNVKIYNATRGGELEIFERVDLDKVLEGKQ